MPPKSVSRFFCQRILPLAMSMQARSPSEPSAYSTLPSTVGVDRARDTAGFWSRLAHFADASLPNLLAVFHAQAWTNSLSMPLLLTRKMRSPTTAGVE